jgi:hypothetical protein
MGYAPGQLQLASFMSCLDMLVRNNEKFSSVIKRPADLSKSGCPITSKFGPAKGGWKFSAISIALTLRIPLGNGTFTIVSLNLKYSRSNLAIVSFAQ